MPPNIHPPSRPGFARYRSEAHGTSRNSSRETDLRQTAARVLQHRRRRSWGRWKPHNPTAGHGGWSEIEWSPAPPRPIPAPPVSAATSHPAAHTRFPRNCHVACDRKSVGEGKSVSVRVELGGRRNIKKKNNTRGSKRKERK